MDQADLYDEDIKKIGVIIKELTQKWSRKPNTRANLQEMAKDANDRFLKAGFVVNVQWENTLIVVPDTSAPGGTRPLPITIEVLGRVSSSGYGEMVEGVELMDHERKRHEVLRANERGEAYLGQKGKSA